MVSPVLPTSGNPQTPAEQVAVVSPPPQPAAPSAPAMLGTPTSPAPTAVIQVASASEQVDLPSAPASPRVDLNTATLEELNKLNGAGLIGRAIMRGRPYTTPEDLLKKRVINRATYERIKDQIAAR